MTNDTQNPKGSSGRTARAGGAGRRVDALRAGPDATDIDTDRDARDAYLEAVYAGLDGDCGAHCNTGPYGTAPHDGHSNAFTPAYIDVDALAVPGYCHDDETGDGDDVGHRDNSN